VYVSAEQAATIVADPRIQGVSVTGSERAGAAVAEVAGRHLKKVALELGGSDPFLVLATDDLDVVVAAATAARLDNTGQSCNRGEAIHRGGRVVRRVPGQVRHRDGRVAAG
jgi:NAD-dependent aldehyde dehydrogenases